MTPEAIHTEVCAVLQEVAAIHGDDVLVNGTTCPTSDLAGIDSQQLLQLTGELAHRLDIDDLNERMREVLASGTPFEREVRGRDGHALLLRILPYELSGQVAGIVLTVIDITLLDDARAALADSEASLRRRLAELQTLYRTAPAGLCFIDKRFRYVRANERMSVIDGVPLDEYPGRVIESVLPPMLAARVREAIQNVLDTGEPLVDSIFRVRTKAHPDEKRAYLVNYYPVSDETSGELLGCSCVVIERRR